jgi:hypothetical protein
MSVWETKREPTAPPDIEGMIDSSIIEERMAASDQ